MWPWRLCRKILITIILHIYLRKSKNNKSITNVNIHIFSLQENPMCFLNPHSTNLSWFAVLMCCGVRHCVQWWHVFPAHKHEKYRSIIFSSKQSRCQIAELTVYFSMTADCCCLHTVLLVATLTDFVSPALTSLLCVAFGVTQKTLMQYVRPARVFPCSSCSAERFCSK